MQRFELVTSEVRFAFPSVFEPKESMDGGSEKYSITLLIPKSDTALVKKIQSLSQDCLEAHKDSKFEGKIPRSPKMPLRDGDEKYEDDEKYEEFKDHYFVNATSTRKPGLVDRNLNDIINRDDFYGGCYGRAAINFFAFNTNGNKGVAAGLEHIQKTRDGEKFVQISTAQDVFTALPDDETDDLL